MALADGTLLPIAEVQVGDQVLAYDFDTGETVGREVTATLPHTDWLLEAHFSDGSTMSVTEDHRFWSITDDSWVELQDLDTTDVLLTPDGVTVTVDWLDWDAGVTAPAWDLTVDQEHNFFVAATGSAEPLLVHNNTPSLFCGVPIDADVVIRLSGLNASLVESGRAPVLASVLSALPGSGRQRFLGVLDRLIADGRAVEALQVAENAADLPNVANVVLSDFPSGPRSPNFISGVLGRGSLADSANLDRVVDDLASQNGIRDLQPPARELLENEGVLIDQALGLQTRSDSLFSSVALGQRVEGGDGVNKYLWTIDDRGVNIALESTPFPTPRGNIVHTNLSSAASIGGEAWFDSQNRVIVNAGSGRFGDGAGITATNWDAAVSLWEDLGYDVIAVPFGSR